MLLRCAKNMINFNHSQFCKSLCISITNEYIYETCANIISFNLCQGFLQDRHIHEAIGAIQEAIHIIKTRDQATFILKIDLSKAYDKAS